MAKVEFREERCKGCGICIKVCPRQIILSRQDKLNDKGFHPVGIDDMERCIGCAFCAIMCPDEVIEVYK